MQKKICPICETDAYSKIEYEENLPKKRENINFSGRKNPDGYHYEMQRCGSCSLLYASSIHEVEFTNQLYNESNFIYNLELEGLKKTYGNCLTKAEDIIQSKENFLEIGCGNGFLLEVAIQKGWKNVAGIEPSFEAINNANEAIKNKIIHSIFESKNFEKNYYNLVFFAMLIEHVPDVNKFLSGIYDILKPGGIVIGICHNERHFLSKLLKNKHPIINDEHNYVFGKETLEKIFIKNRFRNIIIDNLKNYYPISYWLKMAPLPKIINSPLTFISKLLFNNKNIGIKAGNLFLTAKK